jgi:hypothetical protein
MAIKDTRQELVAISARYEAILILIRTFAEALQRVRSHI